MCYVQGMFLLVLSSVRFRRPGVCATRQPTAVILELRGQQKAIRAWVRLEDLSPTLIPDILKRSDLAANV
jgi:hypothetical protein